MAKFAEFTSNFDDYKQILEFKKDFKHNIIQSGLDKPLKTSLDQLKSDLKFVINEKIRVIPDSQKGVTDNAEESPLGQPYINPPKSEDEILRYLTDGKTDLAKYNKAKDYTTLGESNVVFGHRSTGQASANRVTLRLEIGPDETVEQQYQKARTFFQDAIFALPDSAGKTAYFMNPGVDISQYLKIKCSVFTGDGDIEPLQGMSPKTRFEKDKRRGYAQWTLQQDGVSKIKNSFLDLSQAVDLIKEGDYESARKVLISQARRVKVRETAKLTDLADKLTNLQQNKASLPLSTQSYTNAIELINNLAISKKITEETITYSLVSSYADFTDKEVNFNDHIQATIRSWVAINEDEWFNKLVESTESLIKYYTSTFTSSVES